VERLLRILEGHHPATARHCRRVGCYSLVLAEALGLAADQRRVLWLAACLHDVGKLSLPAALLDRPGRLSAEERGRVRRHAELGERILARCGADGDLLRAVRHHHERCDGRGYPDGLAGTDIPLLARILAVTDCFDAMTQDRPYQAALALPEALAEVRREAGRQFAPGPAFALLDLLASERRADHVRAE
jgi:putative nucleotidyltransferase with HDIG domain